jgi:hypothetical protein
MGSIDAIPDPRSRSDLRAFGTTGRQQVELEEVGGPKPSGYRPHVSGTALAAGRSFVNVHGDDRRDRTPQRHRTGEERAASQGRYVQSEMSAYVDHAFAVGDWGRWAAAAAARPRRSTSCTRPPLGLACAENGFSQSWEGLRTATTTSRARHGSSRSR